MLSVLSITSERKGAYCNNRKIKNSGSVLITMLSNYCNNKQVGTDD